MGAVMNCNTLSTRQTRMMNFVETARKGRNKNLCTTNKSVTKIPGATAKCDEKFRCSGKTRHGGKVRWKNSAQWENLVRWQSAMENFDVVGRLDAVEKNNGRLCMVVGNCDEKRLIMKRSNSFQKN
jgi:hypothetical protein